MKFFDYQSPYRTNVFLELNMYERIIPIIVLLLMIYVIYRYKDVLREDKRLDKIVRISGGILLFVLYSSHYILRFRLYGFDTIILPFHLCSISMFLAVILLFTNNRTLFAFVMMTGIAGGIISLVNPILGYNSAYYRYYQFMIAHGILVMIPFYYMFVYRFLPSTKEIYVSFMILQGIAVFMAIFNYYMNTDFMFLFLDPDKIEKFPAIKKFGGIPFYIVWVELVGLTYHFVTDKIIRFIENKDEVMEYKKA